MENSETDITRSQIARGIRDGRVTVNGITVTKAGTILRDTDTVNFIPEQTRITDEPENIPLNVVFADNHLMVINKPRGLVVHPGNGVSGGTLLNALLFHHPELRNVARCGIVHRLDKNTAGLMVIAKTPAVALKFAQMFETHDVARTYNGIVEGAIQTTHGTINRNIVRHPINRTIYTVTDGPHGRTAVTHWRALDNTLTHKTNGRRYTLMEFKLETGRTHQIRVHCKSAGWPLVGDPEYNPNGAIKCNGQMLEATSLEFLHPITGKSMRLEIDHTPEFKKVLGVLR